jgi:tetratricopeptide (TPR) repeat protein
MPWSRSASLAVGSVVSVLLGWTAVILLSPPSTRLWVSFVFVASVGIAVTYAWRQRHAIGSIALRSSTHATRVVAQPTREYVVPFALPPSALVIGRDMELDQIVEFLRRPEPSGPRVVVISGPPGIGKSALAIKAAHWVADRYADGALFASLGGPVVDRSTTEEIAEAVLGGFVDCLQGPEESIPDGFNARRDRFRDLTSTSHDSILAVLDDAPGEAAVHPLLPVGDGCAVLVTSRLSLPIPDALSISLKPLKRKDAIAVLREIVGTERIDQEEEAAEVIAQRSAGSPLALQLAGASLASRPYWTLTAAVDTMELLLEADAPAAGGRFPQALDFSFALLTQEERQALVLLGLLETHTFAPWMLAALLGADEDAARRLCDRLVFARLLEQITDVETDVAAYRVLEHVRDYARAQNSDEQGFADARRRLRKQQKARGNRDLRTMLRELVYPGLERGQLSQALDYAHDALSHARENLAQARKNLENPRHGASAASTAGWRSSLVAARLADAREGEGLALAALAEVLAELGGVDDAMEKVTSALATGTALSAPRALRCLGKLQRRQHRLNEAEATLGSAIDAARLIDDGSEEARIGRELAILWACRGRTIEGLAAVDRTLQLDLRPETAERLRASILVSKAVVLLDAADRSDDPNDLRWLREADRTLCEAVAIADARGQRLWRAWIDYERSRAERRFGHFDRSRTLAFRAMEEFAQMRHRYGTARCRLEVGRSYLDQKRPQEALPALEEARRTLSICGGRWIEAETAVVLAGAQRQVGRVAEAARELALAIGYYEDLDDPDGLATANKMLDELRGARIRGAWIPAGLRAPQRIGGSRTRD